MKNGFLMISGPNCCTSDATPDPVPVPPEEVRMRPCRTPPIGTWIRGSPVKGRRWSIQNHQKIGENRGKYRQNGRFDWENMGKSSINGGFIGKMIGRNVEFSSKPFLIIGWKT